MSKVKSDNPGSFSSWHMERAGDNRYSDGDQTTQPEPGERSKTLVTDGRPAGTHFRDNPWHDSGPGDRGPRADELAKYNDTAYEKLSENDAPFMKGDRARTEDGTLREVRADEQIGNNPTIQERAPDLLKAFGPDFTVGQLRQTFGDLSLSQICQMTQDQRAKFLEGKTQKLDGGLTNQIANLRGALDEE